MAAPIERRRSVRFQLLVLALLPTLLVLPAFIVLVAVWWSIQFDRILISKVHGDLTIARQYLDRLMERSDENLHALGASATFDQIARSGSREELDALLAARRKDLSLDYLYLTDPNGIVIAASPAQDPGSKARRWPVVEAGLRGQASTALDILDASALQQLSEDMHKRARIELVPTAGAAATAETAETRGMVIQSGVPVSIAQGKSGALIGGTLLNQNLAFIDTINDLIYRAAGLPDGSQGTATLFLGDVRISTNVRLFEEKRALGTRVSQSVGDAVLSSGQVWLGRAFVVNDWYISAYEPIVDSYGQRVGMLYVGFLERPFQAAKHTTLAAIVGILLLTMLLTVPILFRLARAIFRPLERMDATILRVERGDFGARTGAVSSTDEIGRLAHHLDALLDLLQVRDRELRDWTEELDRRVEERTSELEVTNRKLETAQQQLVMSEKLAAIGEITAGVAHEINNPVAVIQGNLDVAREVLGGAIESVKTEFKLIDQQVHRITLIVNKLLQFARPSEFAGYDGNVRPSDVITDCLVLIQHLLNRSQIEVTRSKLATRVVAMNQTELQQVVLNLLVNALHAMPNGGTLSLRSRDVDLDGIRGVAIVVSDTGVGIPPENVNRIFDAFFTTKPRTGTGLGLSISYALVARHGGRMSVESVVGEGSTFTVWLPTDLKSMPIEGETAQSDP